MSTSTISIQDFGLASASLADIHGGETPELNAELAVSTLTDSADLTSYQRALVLNAGIGFYVSGKADSIKNGVELATETLLSGQALRKLESLKS